MNPLYIVLAVLIFGFLIFIHELGHYIFARIFKVKINEFSIGMGPAVFSRESRRTGITYSLRILPFGGFVSMAGEDEESDDENAFSAKPPLKRLLISAAGAAVNILAGVIAMTCLVISSPELYSTVIDTFPESSSVDVRTDGYLLEGDEIVKIGSARVFCANDLQYEIMRRAAEPVDVTVIRNGERVVVDSVVFPTISDGGITYGLRDFTLSRCEKNFGNVLRHAAVRSYSTIKSVYDSLFDLISGRYGVSSVSGPVGVTKALGEAAESGISNFVYLAAFISINLGVMNLLPLPALDGGRIVFILIELVTRKKVPMKYESVIHFLGFLLLFILLIAVTFKDVAGLLV